jgi:hypothetical protein
MQMATRAPPSIRDSPIGHGTRFAFVHAMATKTKSTKRGSGKRESIKPNGDARYVRRDGQGQFRESDDVGRSQRQDRGRKAKTKVKSGYGDRGDRK